MSKAWAGGHINRRVDVVLREGRPDQSVRFATFGLWRRWLARSLVLEDTALHDLVNERTQAVVVVANSADDVIDFRLVG